MNLQPVSSMEGSTRSRGSSDRIERCIGNRLARQGGSRAPETPSFPARPCRAFSRPRADGGTLVLAPDPIRIGKFPYSDRYL